MKVTVHWHPSGPFTGTSSGGHRVLMDGPTDKGGQDRGARPMELLLLGIGGCSSFDVTQILQKSRQAVSQTLATIQATRADAIPAVFTAIHLHFDVYGSKLDPVKVARAVSLSAEKYCSASIMMQASGAVVTHSYTCHPAASVTTESNASSSTLQTSTAAKPEQQPKPPAGMQGLHHLALFVTDLEACTEFYVKIIGMTIEWQPDEDNIYLCSGSDNFALHRAKQDLAPTSQQSLDHIGFVLQTPANVYAWHDYLLAQGVQIQSEPRQHRDGATSFYAKDPANTLIQFIHHPPISRG